jgi:hypothetical protein
MAKKQKCKVILRLTVDFNPNGESIEELIANVAQVVKDAVNNGTLSGEGPAEVDRWTAVVRDSRMTHAERLGAQ